MKTKLTFLLALTLFLFGFTLITVSPVFAQSTKDLEDRINRLEVQICDRLPELTLCSDSDIQDKRKKVEDQRLRERTKNFDKDPFTYSQDGSIRQSPDGKFRCVGFPKVRSVPECEKKFKEAKERTKRLFQSETGVRFPDK